MNRSKVIFVNSILIIVIILYGRKISINNNSHTCETQPALFRLFGIALHSHHFYLNILKVAIFFSQSIKCNREYGIWSPTTLGEP